VTKPPLDDVVARRVLWSLPTGLYLLGSTGDPDSGPWNLMTINLVTQVATSPRVVAFSVEHGSRTESLLDATGVASLSILRREDRGIVRRFVKQVEDVTLDESGRPVAMAGHAVSVSGLGTPVLGTAAAWIDLVVNSTVDFESHRLYLAEVVAAGASEEVLAGPASERSVELLRMEDTRMNYGG